MLLNFGQGHVGHDIARKPLQFLANDSLGFPNFAALRGFKRPGQWIRRQLFFLNLNFLPITGSVHAEHLLASGGRHRLGNPCRQQLPIGLGSLMVGHGFAAQGFVIGL